MIDAGIEAEFLRQRNDILTALLLKPGLRPSAFSHGMSREESLQTFTKEKVQNN
jgi:hypothetical protein